MVVISLLVPLRKGHEASSGLPNSYVVSACGQVQFIGYSLYVVPA